MVGVIIIISTILYYYVSFSRWAGLGCKWCVCLDYMVLWPDSLTVVDGSKRF